MNTNEKITIEQANPFIGLRAIDSIYDLKKIKAKIELITENGIVVVLPNGETSILPNLNDEDLYAYKVGNGIDIYYSPQGDACKCEDDKLELYETVTSKALDGHIFRGRIVDVDSKGVSVIIDGLRSFMPNEEIGYKIQSDMQSHINEKIDVKVIGINLKEKERNRFLPIVSQIKLLDEKLNEIKVVDIINSKNNT